MQGLPFDETDFPQPQVPVPVPVTAATLPAVSTPWIDQPPSTQQRQFPQPPQPQPAAVTEEDLYARIVAAQQSTPQPIAAASGSGSDGQLLRYTQQMAAAVISSTPLLYTHPVHGPLATHAGMQASIGQQHAGPVAGPAAQSFQAGKVGSGAGQPNRRKRSVTVREGERKRKGGGKGEGSGKGEGKKAVAVGGYGKDEMGIGARKDGAVRSAVEEARLRAQREAAYFASSLRDPAKREVAIAGERRGEGWEGRGKRMKVEGGEEEEDCEAEKQERYQRRLDMNRESAAVSRVRRRAYVKELEERLAGVEAEKLQLEGKLEVMFTQNETYRKQLEDLFMMVASGRRPTYPPGHESSALGGTVERREGDGTAAAGGGGVRSNSDGAQNRQGQQHEQDIN